MGQAPSCLGVDYKELGFPDSSTSKKYICNAGDPGSIPISRLGRSVGEGIGYPIQYSWAFLAQFPNTFEDFKAEK